MSFKELIFGNKKNTEENLTVSSFGAFNFWLYLAFFLTGSFFYLLGMHSPKRYVNQAVNQINSNLSHTVEEINSAQAKSMSRVLEDLNNNQARSMSEWLYKTATLGVSPSNIAVVERKKTWEQILPDIKKELSFCHDWFDTVSVLSTWLYQNTRVGCSDYNIEFAFGKDNNKWKDTVKTLDLKWFYDINNSDSVVSFCGSHCYYATRLYDYFNFKSYHLSLAGNWPGSSSADGHMINVIQNPHNHKWYPVDHMFGIRWTYAGKWLDIEKYMNLSKKQVHEIDVEYFGTFKFQIYDSPFITSWDCCYESMEVSSVEVANHQNYFRIVAPYSLKKQFNHYQSLFDSIAATYHQPDHVDWSDLARRMPMYGARLFSPLHYEEQPQADSLLEAWRNPKLEL